MGLQTYPEALLAQKDQEIKSLESSLNAYIGRVSVLQTRLLATLDTLDAMKNSHTQELSASKLRQDHLQSQLDRYMDTVRMAEIERDDMRDAVLRLVEKVETSDDYSNWPRSQIYLSNLSEPRPIANYQFILEEKELISYASVLVESLRRERDQERRAHAQAREAAESQILALETKLARREAELELCGTDHVLDIEANTPDNVIQVFENEPIMDGQIISVLDNTVSRNKILEDEVKMLVRRLEEARTLSSSSKLADDSSRTNSATRVVETNGQIEAAPKFLFPGSPGENRRVPDTAERLESSPDLIRNILRNLDLQIGELGDKIDAFSKERLANLQIISAEPTTEHNKQPQQNIMDRLQSLEIEYARLRTSETRLRDELDATKNDALIRENELQQQIRSLQFALATPPETNNEARNLQDFLDADDGEMSMELATPLLPLNTIAELSPSNPSSNIPSSSASPSQAQRSENDLLSPFIEPSSIPLPPSPEDDLYHARSPTIILSQMVLYGGERSSHYQAASNFVAELRQVETQLAATAIQLQEGENALNQVEDLVNELHS